MPFRLCKVSLLSILQHNKDRRKLLTDRLGRINRVFQEQFLLILKTEIISISKTNPTTINSAPGTVKLLLPSLIFNFTI